MSNPIRVELTESTPEIELLMTSTEVRVTPPQPIKLELTTNSTGVTGSVSQPIQLELSSTTNTLQLTPQPSTELELQEFAGPFVSNLASDLTTKVPKVMTLTINGVTQDLSTNRSWTIDALPSQTGQNGKFLSTDGATALWETIPTFVETDPIFNAWLLATPPLYSFTETDPVFNAWLLATPPLYSFTETDPVFNAWLLATPPLYSETDPVFNAWLLATPPLYFEIDPVFTASEAANITSTDITNLSNLSGTNTGDQDLSGYFLLDQTTPQTVINGTPVFNLGVGIGSLTTISQVSTSGSPNAKWTNDGIEFYLVKDTLPYLGSGANGFVVVNNSLPLVDFAFMTTDGNGGYNISSVRYETRGGYTYTGGNELQFGSTTTYVGGFGYMPNLFLGGTYSSVTTGLSIGQGMNPTAPPTNGLSVVGDIVIGTAQEQKIKLSYGNQITFQSSHTVSTGGPDATFFFEDNLNDDIGQGTSTYVVFGKAGVYGSQMQGWSPAKVGTFETNYIGATPVFPETNLAQSFMFSTYPGSLILRSYSDLLFSISNKQSGKWTANGLNIQDDLAIGSTGTLGEYSVANIYLQASGLGQFALAVQTDSIFPNTGSDVTVQGSTTPASTTDYPGAASGTTTYGNITTSTVSGTYERGGGETVPDVTNASLGFDNSNVGYYSNNDQYVSFTIYANIGGAYSTNGTTVDGYFPNDMNPNFIILSWDDMGADYYRVVVNTDGDYGASGDHYFDVPTNYANIGYNNGVGYVDQASSYYTYENPPTVTPKTGTTTTGFYDDGAGNLLSDFDNNPFGTINYTSGAFDTTGYSSEILNDISYTYVSGSSANLIVTGDTYSTQYHIGPNDAGGIITTRNSGNFGGIRVEPTQAGGGYSFSVGPNSWTGGNEALGFEFGVPGVYASNMIVFSPYYSGSAGQLNQVPLARLTDFRSYDGGSLTLGAVSGDIMLLAGDVGSGNQRDIMWYDWNSSAANDKVTWYQPTIFTKKVTTQLTTVQQQIGYDSSNYYTITVGSTGTTTFDATGSGAKFVFSDRLSLIDGAVATPSYSFTNATNGTGFYHTGTTTNSRIEIAINGVNIGHFLNTGFEMDGAGSFTWNNRGGLSMSSTSVGRWSAAAGNFARVIFGENNGTGFSLEYDSTNLIVSAGNGVGTTTLRTFRSSGVMSGYVAKTANYTLTTNDYTVNCTANSFTLTLPTAVGFTGQIYNLKNSGTGTITVATTSSQTIDGKASGVITLAQRECLTVQSDGANWMVL